MTIVLAIFGSALLILLIASVIAVSRSGSRRSVSPTTTHGGDGGAAYLVGLGNTASSRHQHGTSDHRGEAPGADEGGIDGGGSDSGGDSGGSGGDGGGGGGGGD
jgi:hypothetical protein